MLLPAALLAASCDYTFDLEFEADPALFVECIPGARDTTVIKVFPADPVNEPDRGSGWYNKSDIKVGVSVDGTPVEVKMAEKDGLSMREGWFYIVENLAPGVSVSVEASLEGFPSARAETVIPQAPPEYEAAVYATGDDSTVDAEILMKESSGQERYYGMQVIRSTEYTDGRGEEVTDERVLLVDDTSFGDISYESGVMTVRYSGDMAVWKSADSGPSRLRIRMGASLPHGEVHRIRYMFRLYRLTPELFRYYTVQYNTGSGGDTSSDMFYPPNTAYTNVDGGLGIIGGLSCVETGWMETGE